MGDMIVDENDELCEACEPEPSWEARALAAEAEAAELRTAAQANAEAAAVAAKMRREEVRSLEAQVALLRQRIGFLIETLAKAMLS
jgi:hypothetical protein